MTRRAIREIAARIPGDPVDREHLAVAELKDRTAQSFGHRGPPARRRTERIRERHIVTPRPDPLLGRGIPLDEGLHRVVIPLQELLKIRSRFDRS